MGCVLGMGTFVAGPVPPASIPVLSAEHGPVSEHGRAGGNEPADGELPFGDVISPASHLAS
jgi:hypothetical protein